MKQHKIKLDRILELFEPLKSDVWAVYIYAILNGLIQLSLPLGIQAIISFVLGGYVSTSLIILISMVVFGILANGILQLNQMKIIEKLQQELFVRYAFRFSDHLPLVSPAKINLGLKEKVNYFFDIVPLQKGVSKLLLDVPTATIQILFGLIVLCFYHPIFIAFGLILLFIFYLILHFTGNSGLETSIQESNFKYKTAASLLDIARVTFDLKFKGKSRLATEKTDKAVFGYIKARTAHFNILLSQYWTLIIFKVLIIAFMLIVGVSLLLDGKLNIGQFIAIEIVVISVLNAIEKIIVNLDKIYDVFTAFNKLDQLLETPKETTGMYSPEFESGIQISGSSISLYGADQELILKDAQFYINKGEKVFLSGNNAYSRALFLQTISGMNTSYSGELTINQLPIFNYHLADLRLKYGVLMGHTGIIRGTILQNILLGRDEISVQEVLELSKQTGFSTLLQSLRLGLDTQLPSTQLTFEYERYILLLRAFIGNPSILILEEPLCGISPQRSTQLKQYIFDTLKDVSILMTGHDDELANKCTQDFIFNDATLVIEKKNNR
jgi:ATP-binding cassette, subfamily B, bacterial